MTEVYSAVIQPPFEIAETIKIFKQGLESVIGKYPGYYAAPVITLFAAMCDEDKMAGIEKKVEVICRNHLPFQVRFQHFGEFYNNKTLFVDVDDAAKSALSSFRKKLSAEIKLAKYDEDVDFNIGKTPHITIGRTLSEEQYKIAKKYFANRKYDAGFECKEVIWRKLVQKNGFQEYDTIRSFPFAQKNLSLF